MTVTAVPVGFNKDAIRRARFAKLHSLISAQAGGYFPVTVGGEIYVGHWLRLMAYAFAQTGTADYKTDALNEFNYMAGLADSNGVLVYPNDSTKIYRDFYFRHVYHAALASRIFRNANNATTAQTILNACDAWAEAWLDKINSGSPYASVTRHGWDASNATGAPVWAASTFYAVGQRRQPTIANGHVYEAQSSGFSSSVQPTWPTGAGTTVVDRDVTWLEVVSHVAWQATTAYTAGQIVIPTAANGRTYRCIVSGTSAGSAPTWPTGDQTTVVDGGVTWRCTSNTQPTSFATYTNNGTTYPAIGSADLDLNQVAEEAAMFALLVSDSNSAFANAGTYRTKALNRITESTGLLTSYQCSGGRVPVGDPISPTDGRAMFDTLYGAFTASLLAVVYQLVPLTAHPDLGLMLNGLLDWINTEHATEPLSPIDHYSGSSLLHIEEPGYLIGVYELMNRPNPLQDLTYKSPFNFGSSALWGDYVDTGPPQSINSDALQSRMMEGEARSYALTPTTTTGTARFPSSTIYPDTVSYPGQGLLPIVRCRLSFGDVSDPTPSWVEVASNKFRDYATGRGRGSELSEHDAGTAAVVLDNRDRTYDPNSNASIRPLNRLWLYEEFSGEVHDIFKGYVSSWDQSWPGGGWSDAIVTANAVDELGLLALYALPLMDPPRTKPDIGKTWVVQPARPVETTYADVVLSDNPTGYWKMEDVNGSQMIAATVGDNFESVASTISFPSGSPILGSSVDATHLLLDTSADLAATPQSTTPTGDPNGGSAMALETWINVVTLPGTDAIIVGGPRDSGSVHRYELILKTTGVLTFTTWNSVAASVSISTPVINTGTWYHVAGTVSGGTQSLYLNGILRASSGFSGAFASTTPVAGDYLSLGTGATAAVFSLAQFAFYPVGLSASRVAAHYTAGTGRGFPQQSTGARVAAILDAISSHAPRALNLGVRQIGARFMYGQSPLDESRAALSAENVDAAFFASAGGTLTFLKADDHANVHNSAQVTLGDAGGAEIPYEDLSIDYSDAFLFNEWNVTRDGGNLQTASDATSISRYFKRSQSLSGLPLVSDADAVTIAAAMLAKYKDPMQRVTSVTLDCTDPAVAAAVFRCDLGDKITVNRTPPGGGARISQDLWIQQVSVSGANDGRAPMVTWGVSPK